MKILIDSYNKNKDLHHAYLIEGVEASVLGELHVFIEQTLRIPVVGNPDVWHGNFEKFGIYESKKIREMQANKAMSGKYRIFVVSATFMTQEAQNALLKVFEEPTPGTHFFIITPRADALLPTLRSRLFVVSRDMRVVESGNTEEEFLAEKFLQASITERLSLVKPIIEEKDKSAFMHLINMLEEHIAHMSTGEKRAFVSVLDDLVFMRGHLYGNAPSIKMMAEHLSITTPRHMT
mgnify:CR=1 FL=1